MTLKMPTIKQLKYFVCVAETGTFRSAAERLGISQPTLTAQIYSMEKNLQLTLLERSRSGTTVTPAGRQLLGNARQVIEEMHGLVDQAALINQGPSGIFRIGVSPTLGPYLLPYILPSLHRTYTSLKLYVRENMPEILERDLLEGRLDLVLIDLPFGSSRLTTKILFHEPFRLAVPEGHPLAKLKQIKAKHLQQQNVLTLERHSSSYHQVHTMCEQLGANIARDYEGTSLDALRQMVMTGMGVAFLPSLYIYSEIHQPQELNISDLKELQLYRTHVLAWRQNSPNRSFYRQLAELIRSLVKENLGDAQLFFDD